LIVFAPVFGPPERDRKHATLPCNRLAGVFGIGYRRFMAGVMG
jgi:hypothetical protein|tara:strand:- start:10785 stop:10913 length:129 start_codon:yes stop_codon:yes gene_type:complete